MIIDIHLENHDSGRPCEVANALIDKFYDKCDTFEEGLNELEEIAEHIKTYVSYAKLRGVKK